MSEEVKENGTKSEEVPEIELIIKVRIIHSYNLSSIVCIFVSGSSISIWLTSNFAKYPKNWPEQSFNLSLVGKRRKYINMTQ